MRLFEQKPDVVTLLSRHLARAGFSSAVGFLAGQVPKRPRYCWNANISDVMRKKKYKIGS